MTDATYRVTHRTDYEYEKEVTASYGQLHLLPRELPGQRCLSAAVIVEPSPELTTASGSTSSATASPSSRCTSRTAQLT
jgi:hypothetical protein